MSVHVDLRNAIEWQPALAGLALWVRLRESDEDTVAYTDGNHVVVGKRYHGYEPKHRQFILLHELLHCALAHPTRMRQMARKHQDFVPELYNYVADGLINAALKTVRGIAMPPDGVEIEPILREIDQWPDGTDETQIIRNWSSEGLYYAVLEHIRKNADGNGEGGGNKAPPNGMNDIRPKKGSSSDVADAEEIREWSSRLAPLQGRLPGMLQRLTAEFPQTKTPWERVLRSYLLRHVGRRTMVDPARPSRRWLVMGDYLRRTERIELPFDPDRSRPAPAGRVGLVIDTSGSIGDDILSRFSGEMATLIEQTGAKSLLVVCDAAVQHVQEIPFHKAREELRRMKYPGGGGTDFAPAIAKLAEWKPDVCVYFTDLMGNFGPEPKFPIVWAVPPGNPNIDPPWGVRLDLE